MLTTTTARDRAIAQLFEIRESAVADLNSMPMSKVGSEWQADRINDIVRCNRTLVAMGAIPGEA